jgi:hypothetical protein
MTTRRDISLNVIADISKYQEQFAKIPGCIRSNSRRSPATPTSKPRRQPRLLKSV